MRQSFIIEKSADEEVEFSAVENSNKVRITVSDMDSDTAEVELTLKEAKEVRQALDKAITLAENPYTFVTGQINASRILTDYYVSPTYRFGRYGF